jgi:hypothetical protein
MRGRRLALFLSIALAVAPVVIAQTPSIPAFVVPTFADLTIKKRHSFGTTSSTEVLYLKGARERREFLYEQPGNGRPGHAVIMQCDQRRSVQLNPGSVTMWRVECGRRSRWSRVQEPIHRRGTSTGFVTVRYSA